uniref:Uncharacterized protein n=1 Tax=Rhizophora mucronata TaxID=61149 RepID=A0A2P2LU02_RHIMU
MVKLLHDVVMTVLSCRNSPFVKTKVRQHKCDPSLDSTARDPFVH